MSKPSEEDLKALDEANRLFASQVPKDREKVESEIFCIECRHVHKPSEGHVK